MQLIQMLSEKINRGVLVAAVLLLLFLGVVIPIKFFVPSDQSFNPSVMNGEAQEAIGYVIQALARYDQERVERLQAQWSSMVQRSKELEHTRAGRLQQVLGQAVAGTGQMTLREQARLRMNVVRASDELAQFKRERASRHQEQLGQAILDSFRRAPAGGTAFQAAFQREVARLNRVEGRTLRRLETDLEAAKVAEARFRSVIPLLYREAIQSAHRSFKMREDSEIAWTGRMLNELKEDLAWKRQSEDYVQTAESVREILAGLPRESESEGYGLYAMVGLMLAMIWVAFITRKDNTEWKFKEAIKTNPFYRWGKEVKFMSQSITVFSWPKEVIFGSNVSTEVGRYAVKDNIQQAMILTDEGVSSNDLLTPLKSSFSQAGVECKVYDQVKGEVPDTVISQAFDLCKAAKVNLLVAVGGGSVIDTAKAVGILLTNGGKIQDYEGVDKVQWPITSLYVVPTTAGCGSEASQFCVVLDTKRKKKIEIISRKIIPQRIFIDPLLTLTMPPELTASCGMDALSNCIEAYFSTWATPLTDALALHAIRLISGSLRPAVANRKNLEAHQQMAMAAFEAGLAFTNAHSGAVHALGHPIAGMFNVPQRLGNAILLPHVMRYNMNADMDRMVDVAVAMGEPISGLSKREAAEKAIAAVQCLLVDIGLPTSLEKVGVEKKAISELTQQALQDTFLRTNPRILNTKDIERIYESAFLDYEELPYASAGRRREMSH
jgi:1,3-propanediol dehydrogenase